MSSEVSAHKAKNNHNLQVKINIAPNVADITKENNKKDTI